MALGIEIWEFEINKKLEMETKKTTVTATFPGIGKVEISRERADKILWLQKIIREHESKTSIKQPKSNNRLIL